MIISAWWLQTSSKLSGKKSNKQGFQKHSKMDNYFERMQIRQNIALPPLSRDRRIKIEQNSPINA